MQAVTIESKISKFDKLDRIGVPQWTALMGLIYIIYASDYPWNNTDGESVCYVDDSTDTVTCDNIEDLKDKIQKQALQSSDWLEDNKMVISEDKTKLIIVMNEQARKKIEKDS